MKKQIHLGYDLSWTHLDGRWRSPGSWSHVNFPDIRMYEEIAQIAAIAAYVKTLTVGNQALTVPPATR